MDDHSPAPLAPTKSAGRGVLVVLSLGAFIALAGVAGWLWLPRPAAPRRGPAAAPAPAATSEALAATREEPATVLAPKAALWCTYAEAFSCALTRDDCELARGKIRAPSEPCAAVYPWCFAFDTGKRAGKICAPSSDGCEQLRTGPLGAAAQPKTGCIREPAQQIASTLTSPTTDLFGTAPLEQWCTGDECAAAEADCIQVRIQLKSQRPCERRRLYCYGEAPLPFVDCAPTLRACERLMRERVADGRGDFGPCRIMP